MSFADIVVYGSLTVIMVSGIRILRRRALEEEARHKAFRALVDRVAELERKAEELTRGFRADDAKDVAKLQKVNVLVLCDSERSARERFAEWAMETAADPRRLLHFSQRKIELGNGSTVKVIKAEPCKLRGVRADVVELYCDVDQETVASILSGPHSKRLVFRKA